MKVFTRYLTQSTLSAALCISLGLTGCAMQSHEQTAEVRQALNDQSLLIEQQQVTILDLHGKLEEVSESQSDFVHKLDKVSSLVTRLVAPQQPQQALVEEPKKEVVEEAAPAKLGKEKLLLGRNEWVWVDILGANLKARIDTGSSSSTFNAVNVQPFERNGERWVSFEMPDDKAKTRYETRFIRYAKIRQAGEEEIDRRVVVKLRIHVGEHVEEAEFSLTNRDNMLYPITLGRSFLKDIAIVDVAEKFVQPRIEYSLQDDAVAAEE